MLSIPRWKFIPPQPLINVTQFAIVYLIIGINHLNGMEADGYWKIC